MPWSAATGPGRSNVFEGRSRDDAFFPPRKGFSPGESIDQILDIGHTPPAAARRANAAVVQGCRQAAQIANARRSKRLDDRQHGEGCGFLDLNPSPKSRRFSNIVSVAEVSALSLARRQRRPRRLRYESSLLLSESSVEAA
jgi:hypothetical protein